MAQEQQDQREVLVARTNTTTIVANVICATDSGEQLKVTLWGEQVTDYYDLFEAGNVSIVHHTLCRS